MVKKLLALLVVLGMLLSGPLAYSEGWKTMGKGELTVTVPESAPEFFGYPHGRILGTKQYDNGNRMMLVELANEEQMVFVALLVAKVYEDFGVIAIQVNYMRDRANPKSDLYEDVQFMQTGKMSKKLALVKTASDYKRVEIMISGKRI